MVKYTSAILASAALATTVVANQPVCSVVTEVVTGDWEWVAVPTWADWAATTTTSAKPADPTWGDWTTTTAKTVTVKKSSTTSVPATWADWDTTTTTKKAAVTTTTVVDPTWLDWTTTTTTTTTTTVVDPTWLDWTSSSAAVTTTTTAAPTSWETPATTTTTTTTTTSAAPAAATCPADNGKSVTAGGSCDCEYAVNCGVHADTSSGPAFWNKGTTDSLAECLSLCDNNDKCTATIWCDDTTQCGSDYHVCWQTNGLGGIAGTGFGQISYKGSCSGSCSQSYES